MLTALLLTGLTACGNHFFNIDKTHTLAQQKSAITQSNNDDRDYKVIRLPNDLEIVLVSDASLERSAVALAVAAGSYDETKGFWGQAHFLEHMLFLGTKKYPKVGSYSEYISKNGGVNNAYTDMDHTNYYATVKNNAYEGLLDRFSDYFVAPLLSSEYIEKERNAVHSEWSMKGVYDGVILGHLNGLTLNPKHPVANFTWGNLDSLVDQNGETLHQTTVDFFNQFYVANQMKVALVSNRSIAELEKLAQQYFKGIKSSANTKDEINVPAIEAAQLKKVIRYKPNKDLKKIQMKFVIADNSAQFLSKPNYYVSYLLNSEMPNTLQATLKKKNLIKSLYAWADASAFGNAGEFVIDIDLTKQGLAHKDDIINSVFNYIKLIELKGINTSYYQEISQSLQNSFHFQSKYSEYNYASSLAAKMHEVPNKYLLSSYYEFSDFNEGNIRELLSQLTIDNMRVFFIDKSQKTQQKMRYFDGEYAIENISSQQINKWQHAPTKIEVSLPRLNTLLPKDFSIAKQAGQENPELLKSALGSISYFKNSTTFDVPKGSITANLNTKLGTASAKDRALLLLLNQVINEEISSLANEASGAGMSLGLYLNRGLNLSTSGFSDKQFELQRKAFKLIKALEFNEQQFALAKTSIETVLTDKNKDTPYTQAFAQYNTFLTKGDFSSKDLLQALGKIKMEDLAQFYANFLQSARLNNFVFGNFTKESVTYFVEHIEKVLNLNMHKENQPLYFTQFHQFTEQEQVNVKVAVQQNDVAIIDAKWQEHSVKRAAIAKVLAKIVSPALFKQIRTEEQLGYSVGFYSSTVGEQVSYAWYVQTPVKSPKDMLQRFDTFKTKFSHEISLLDEVKLQQYRQAVLVQLQQKSKNIYQEGNEYMADWRLGKFNYNSKALLIDAVKNVNVADIQHIYKEVVDPKKMARVVVQIKGKNFPDESFIKLSH